MDLESIINYEFNDKSLLKTALTHSSFTNEHREPSNERLEFLGDAIADMIVSVWLYRAYPDADEGRLTQTRAKIVCEASFANAAEKISLHEHMRFGHGEVCGGGKKPSILADCFEAVVGAVYLDGGFESAEALLKFALEQDIQQIYQKNAIYDYKSKLQEYYQAKHGTSVTYEVTGRTGPDHDPFFNVRVLHEGRVIGEGSGHSKKEAEQDAARDAYKKVM